jgi:hypothetical protein
MTPMTRSQFWRSFEHGQGLGALFVDFKPPSVRSPERIAQYVMLSRYGAIVLLCVVVAGCVILVKTGHVWAGIALVGVTILSTVVQLVNHHADHEAD